MKEFMRKVKAFLMCDFVRNIIYGLALMVFLATIFVTVFRAPWTAGIIPALFIAILIEVLDLLTVRKFSIADVAARAIGYVIADICLLLIHNNGWIMGATNALGKIFSEGWVQTFIEALK